ncbi:hypothetical protein ACFQX7_30540 [Luedemannella flava]
MTWFVQPGETATVGEPLPWHRGSLDELPGLPALPASAVGGPTTSRCSRPRGRRALGADARGLRMDLKEPGPEITINPDEYHVVGVEGNGSCQPE